MEFFFAVFFLLFYFVRPQDWVPGLIGLSLVKPIIFVWFGVLLSYRSRVSPLVGLLRTPHDWIILIYWLYVAWNAPDSMGALKGFLPFVAFYALTVQSITSWPRLHSYFKWWTIALVILAVLAVLIPLGIDLTGGKGPMDALKGRLSLGTWQHDNPNALGHSVIVLIPVSYFLFFWRGTATGRLVLFPMIAGLSFWCVYLTESKGAFLVGGIMVVSLYVIGRPRFVQFIAIILALTLGVGALSFLPRMSQMGDLGSDPGVQGRLMAWEIARGVTETQPTGVGWQEFTAVIAWKEGKYLLYVPKATHSSYVQVAADLGRYGLFIYLAGLWCVVHTLLSFRPGNDLEGRCTRILWALLISTIVSGWMINRQYHTEHFLLLAAAAALHRLGMARELGLAPTAGSESSENEQFGVQAGEKILEVGSSTETVDKTPTLIVKTDYGEASVKPLWNKFGILDVGVCIGLTWLTFWVWDYILVNMSW
jgi:hypothetical protein